jgi:non-specific serine/threonine protein kinase
MQPHLQEGRDWLTSALARVAHGAPLPVSMRRAQAQALLAAGILARGQDDYPTALTLLHESLRAFRELDDVTGSAFALLSLGTTLAWHEEFAAARPLLEEALDLCHIAGPYQGTGIALVHLGSLDLFEGDGARGMALLEQGLAVLREQGDGHQAAHAVFMCGVAALGERDLARARASFQESLRLVVALRDMWGLALVLDGFAGLAAMQGQAERALRLAGAAEAIRERHSVPLAIRVFLGHRERWLAVARQALTEVQQEAALAAGRALTSEQASTLATSQQMTPPAPLARLGDESVNAPDSLTRREREVAHFIARGLTNRQIAATCAISERTVDTHVASILSKLNATTRAQVAVWVVSQGAPAA